MRVSPSASTICAISSARCCASCRRAREQRPRSPPAASCVARDLTPSQLIDLDRRDLAGIALAAGGPTSHVAILAGTLGVPMLVASGPRCWSVRSGAALILDAESGVLRIAPARAELAAARARVSNSARRAAPRELRRGAGDCHLASGERIEVFANLAGTAADTQHAVEQGAEGCGLLRTEFLFLDRTTAPDEAEQLPATSEVARPARRRARW